MKFSLRSWRFSYYQLTKRYEMGKNGRDGLLEKSMGASKKKLEFLDLAVGLLFSTFLMIAFCLFIMIIR